VAELADVIRRAASCARTILAWAEKVRTGLTIVNLRGSRRLTAGGCAGRQTRR
jgi:hypothetical protein